MKKRIYLSTILLFLVLFSCTNSNNKESVEPSDITGLWTLFKEEKQGRTIDYSGVPSATRIELKENGYFLLFDQITNEKINTSDVGSIQDKLRGQYQVNDGVIQLNHYIGDSLVQRKLTILSLDKDVLILKDEKAKTSHYKRR